MTRDEAKQLLPVIQAYADGRAVQFKRSSGEWVDVTREYMFVDPPDCYRIKPEPVECWAVTDGEILLSLYIERSDAEWFAEQAINRRVIRMVEA